MMLTKCHELKCWPMYFSEIQQGRKTFEMRSTADRQFQAGDQLFLREWDPSTKQYTGSTELVDVLGVYHGVMGAVAGWAVMSIQLPQPQESKP